MTFEISATSIDNLTYALVMMNAVGKHSIQVKREPVINEYGQVIPTWKAKISNKKIHEKRKQKTCNNFLKRVK